MVMRTDTLIEPSSVLASVQVWGGYEGVLGFHESARERYCVSGLGQGGDECVPDQARAVLGDDRHQQARLLLHVCRGGLVGRLVVARDELDELVARGFVVGHELAASRQVYAHCAIHHVALEHAVLAVEVLDAVAAFAGLDEVLGDEAREGADEFLAGLFL